MLDAVGLGHGSLWRLRSQVGVRQHVEGFAFVGPFPGLRRGLGDRDRIAVRRPGLYADVVPAFLEVHVVELRQRDGGVRSRHLPHFHLARGADRPGVLRDDLYRKVRESADLARVRRNFEHDTHLAPLTRSQNLLADEIDEPVVVLLLIGDDGKVGCHAYKRDSFRCNLGSEFPLVE